MATGKHSLCSGQYATINKGENPEAVIYKKTIHFTSTTLCDDTVSDAEVIYHCRFWVGDHVVTLNLKGVTGGNTCSLLQVSVAAVTWKG